MFWFLLGILFALGCATAFPYRYYGLNASNYDGTLQGPKPSDDLPLSKCKPDDQVKGKCYVVLASEMDKIKLGYKDLVNQLQTCQSGH